LIKVFTLRGLERIIEDCFLGAGSVGTLADPVLGETELFPVKVVCC